MSDMTPGSRDPMDNRLGVAPESGPILNDDDLDPGREDVARISDWDSEGAAQAGEADDDEVAEEQRIAQRLASGITSPDQGGSTS